MKGLIKLIPVWSACLLVMAGCDLYIFDKNDGLPEYDQVMIMYSAGFNTLSAELQEDISELKDSYLPAFNSGKVLVVVSHATEQYLAYGVPVKPSLVRLYKDKKGNAVADTLTYMKESDYLTKPESMTAALTYIKQRYESKHYGMVFSSHGAGWLPPGYYNNPSKFPTTATGEWKAPARTFDLDGAVPYHENNLPGPKVKSIGEENANIKGTTVSYELTPQQFAQSIPMHLDYLVFDACLLGCVEIAYELKDKCDFLMFSPAEILSDGLNYKTLTQHLLQKEPDLKAVADDFYEHYAAQSGDYQSATLTLVDCSRLDRLAEVCKGLFDVYRDEMGKVKPSTIQRYYRSNRHWLYDLSDILIKSGISESSRMQLETAMNDCCIYKVHTDSFMPLAGGFAIKYYSGMSMYLPCNGNAYLDEYYKTLAWNKATGLVK